MRARRDARPLYATRETRHTRANLWLNGRVSLPAGAGISTLRLLWDLRDQGAMPAQHLGLRKNAMGQAQKEQWVRYGSGHYQITVGGREILMLAECVMGEIDAVWQWVETGVGGVPQL